MPLVAKITHPLRFVVAHRIHARQMRTSWTSVYPRSLVDRDVSRCNISIEPHIVNMFECAFDSKYYPEMFALIRDIQLDASLYKEGLPHVNEAGDSDSFTDDESESIDTAYIDIEDTSDDDVV